MRNIGDLGAAHPGALLFAQRHHVLSGDGDAAAGDATAGAGVAHQRERDRRLAGAAFADQRHDLALGNVEADAVDDLDASAGIGGGFDLQVTDFYEIDHHSLRSRIFFGRLSISRLTLMVRLAIAKEGAITAGAPKGRPPMFSRTRAPQSA